MCKLWIRRNDNWVTPKNVWIRKNDAWKKVNKISIRTPQDTWCTGFDANSSPSPEDYDIGTYLYNWTNPNGYWNTNLDTLDGTNEDRGSGWGIDYFDTEYVTSIDTIDQVYLRVHTGAGPIGFDPLVQNINLNQSLVGQVTTNDYGLPIPVSPGMHSMLYSAAGFNIPILTSDVGTYNSGDGQVGTGFSWSTNSAYVNWSKHLGAIIPRRPDTDRPADTPFDGIGDGGFRGIVDFKICAWWGQQVPTNGNKSAQIMMYTHKPGEYNTMQYMFGQAGINVNKAIVYKAYPDPNSYTRVKSSPISEDQVTVLGTIRVTVYPKGFGYGVKYQIFAP